ncbi:uncharacterized protein EI97DRAFT_436080 [Westerdykella ornata]|uniref:SPRY domain-containing protein n=1 Tax=Westerdykella ornata TaxID=318751 RepID=A0A6A6JAW7_WESOR|nr:uncharacterized protein EI97DRAFT_436080 [Westerdykella ornata]KAF2273425.1 hypothetical protein EI97DRAFT_436080 [Westerdykella ornata]
MFKKLKEKIKGEEGSLSTSSSSSQQQQSQFHPSNPYYVPPPSSQQQHAGWPPSAAPPNPGSASTSQYYPPPGLISSSGYAPPPGPPPNHSSSPSQPSYAPPPGPPPSHPTQQPQPPPYHDWTIIPDTSLLPPPPSIGYDTSPTANATEADSARALAWTQANPLWPPNPNLTPDQRAAIQAGKLALLRPPTFTGDLVPQARAGVWKCRSNGNCPDSALLTSLPAYAVNWDSPLRTGRPKTIYFEVKVTGIGHGHGRSGRWASLAEAEAGVAIGFVAPPYPTFRLPGWERASLAVHGDDGRKYVNDRYGGVDFTTAFRPGDVVGIGMRFALPERPPAYEEQQQQRQQGGGKVLDIEVFFTRNGIREKAWDGNEELDQRCVGGNVGIRGECDLYPAVGVFGGVEFEVVFSPEGWVFNPY